MATKKTKTEPGTKKPASSRPKNIDGVVKPKKSTAKSSSTSKTSAKSTKKSSTKSATEVPVTISATETHIEITAPEEDLEQLTDDITKDTQDSSTDEPQESPQDTPVPEEALSVAEITEAINAAEPEDSTDPADSAIDQELDAIIDGFADAEEVANDGTPIDSAEEDLPKGLKIDNPADGITDSDADTPVQPRTPKKSKKSSDKSRPFRIISRILTILTTGSVIALLVRIFLTNLVPAKFFWPISVVSVLICLFFLFKSFRKKTRVPVLAIVDILSIALTAISIFGFIKIDETMRFLNQNFTDNKEYAIYNVIVNKKSAYNNLDDVKGKVFHSISAFVDTEKLEKAVSEQASATVSYESDIASLLNGSLDSNTYISLLNSGTYDAAIENDKERTYSDNLKVIGEIKVEIEKTVGSGSNLTEESFVVYLSGIDTRSGTMVSNSLSDVNLVIAVNPKTRNILMVAVPRDYYVQLHGTTGLPDKLTHAGTLGGLQLSMATIEDLLEIKFDQYIRVNFNFVVGLVDAIGGITVDSDVNYNIVAYTNPSCVFHPGPNPVGGACALAFARERYSYETGDRHRGENQEQVIEKIFEKITSSSTLISRYSDILNALSGSFETSISTSDITGLVNMQLGDMDKKWTINTYNLNGTTGSAYTYSYPSQELSVMYPDLSTVATAIKKLDAVLEGVPEESDNPDTKESSAAGR